MSAEPPGIALGSLDEDISVAVLHAGYGDQTTALPKAAEWKSRPQQELWAAFFTPLRGV